MPNNIDIRYPLGNKYVLGLLVTALIAAFSMIVEYFLLSYMPLLSALTLAIMIGLILGNTVYGKIDPIVNYGVGLAQRKLLRFGIILYGLRLTTGEIAYIGLQGTTVALVLIVTTFIFVLLMGKWLGISAPLTWLIGMGSSICGAAAVLAAQQVINSKEEDVAISISTVVLFGTLGLFLYPIVFGLPQQHPLWEMPPKELGIYIGSTLHEVAQVTAAGFVFHSEVADIAVITKLFRVLLLGPMLIVLMVLHGIQTHKTRSGTIFSLGMMRYVLNSFPWFAVWFLVAVLVNSLNVIPTEVTMLLVKADIFILSMAMAGLGLTTHWQAVVRTGAKPLILGALTFLWLMFGGLLINELINNGLNNLVG